MIKCRISPYNDKIFIDDTTSSKLNYMKEGYFITKEELEQLQREVFEAGAKAVDFSICNSLGEQYEQIEKGFNDYLSSKSKEGK